MAKVKLDVIKPWITLKLNEILGMEDDVVVEYVFTQLEEKELNPKKMQINLTGFLNARRAREFMVSKGERGAHKMELCFRANCGKCLWRPRTVRKGYRQVWLRRKCRNWRWVRKCEEKLPEHKIYSGFRHHPHPKCRNRHIIRRRKWTGTSDIKHWPGEDTGNLTRKCR